MFRKVLVANRGEIAVRVIQTLQEMGIGAVAVYSDADRAAPHVRLAEEAYPLGGVSSTDTYLSQERLLAIARKSGAEAVHPGYGFLAENATFAEALEEAGIKLIGPPARVIRAMGDKIESRRLMQAAGVPVIPGWDGEAGSIAALRRAAAEVGYPLLVKAAAGGGGKGMRRVDEPAQLAAALESSQREAESAFGDPRVYLEKYLIRPRHVEIQIFGDAQGNAVHLFERECSIQRRHQKIIEESPSPALDDALRARMCAAALQAAHAIGYENAGTVEFILDAGERGSEGARERGSEGATPEGKRGDGATGRRGEADPTPQHPNTPTPQHPTPNTEHPTPYFLEVNTRLQVEHPVTELVTGRDLVRAQVVVAAGGALPFRQEELRQWGHAIECRIYAEDPEQGFLPSTGVVQVYRPPSGPGIRIDSGIEQGSEVTIDYDPLLAKLIAWGEDRPAALEKMDWALAHFVLLGVRTNLAFLRGIVRHPAFRAGDLSTRFLEEHAISATPRDVPPEALAAAALTVAGSTGAQGTRGAERRGGSRAAPTAAPPSPWREAGEWRLG